MKVVGLVLAVAMLWLAQAVGVARLMSRAGFHPVPWFAVTALLGPAMWPLAIVDVVSGLPRPVALRRGSRGPGTLDVFVAVTDYGDLDRVIARIQQQGNFGLLIRGGRPGESFDGDGSHQEMRCLRDVQAA